MPFEAIKGITEAETEAKQRLAEAEAFWKRMEEGGRKSFRKDELEGKWFFKAGNGLFIPYLDKLNEDLALRP